MPTMKRRSKRAPETGRGTVTRESEQQEPQVARTMAIPADEKRKPLAIAFYDAEKDKLCFDRRDGTDLEEFAAIMARLFPRWLEEDFPRLREMLRNLS